MTLQGTFYDRIAGEFYINVLGDLHRLLKPERYLEIGTDAGASLAQSLCHSIAVDPDFAITQDIIGEKPSCHLYQMTSDRFFRCVDPEAVLGGPIDLAFLDGMHIAQFLIRDFANTEKHCRRNSVIVIHDCLPGEYAITHRKAEDELRKNAKRPEWWTGDVWKVLPILRSLRPELYMVITDATPTGLAMITNLDPSSRILNNEYHGVIGATVAKAGEAEFKEFWGSVEITPTSKLKTFVDVSSHFWI